MTGEQPGAPEEERQIVTQPPAQRMGDEEGLVFVPFEGGVLLQRGE